MVRSSWHPVFPQAVSGRSLLAPHSVVAVRTRGYASSSSSMDDGAAGRVGTANQEVPEDTNTQPLSFTEMLQQIKPQGGSDAYKSESSVARSSQRTSAEIKPVTGQHALPEQAQKFINCMMKDGKKSTSQRIFDDMLGKLKVAQLSGKVGSGSRTGVDTSHQDAVNPIKIFIAALDNLKPTIGLTSVRRGGTIYKVPVPMTPRGRQRAAIKWLLETARSKKGAPMADKLAAEVMAAYKKEGIAYGKKMEMHKTAEANRAYAGFARR